MEKKIIEDQKHYYYAQISNESICVGISQLSGEVIQEDLIELETYDSSVIGKRYENKKWIEVPKLEPSLAEKREEAYRTLTHKEDGTALIEYRGVLYTCDSAFAQIKIYEEEAKYSSGSLAQELGSLWATAKEYIRELYKEI